MSGEVVDRSVPHEARVASWWAPLNRLEARLIAASPELPKRPPHPITVAVTAAGRGGGLWLVLCAVTAWRSRDNRRRAVRGAAAVVAGLAVSHLVKRLVPYRPRPEPPGGPARRRLPERPDSSAFPSAHAATAAAFTTAAITYDRRLAAVTVPLTLTAIYGRLRTRVHWPTDVLAGIAIGIGSARTLERLR